MANHSATDRFQSKLANDGDCLVFTGGKQPHGHGTFWDGERVVLAHRFAYTLWVGPIPEGVHLHHACENPSCCNPEHLSPLTPGEHLRAHGTSNGNEDKTHCLRGHPLFGENLYLYQKGGRTLRQCRECQRTRKREWRRRGGKT